MIFKKLFIGHSVPYKEMFETRGYRGLNIVPYPDHIKDDLRQGRINKRMAYTLGKVTAVNREKGRVDFTNYDSDLEQSQLQSKMS